jgi:hypothetical protein
MRVWTSRIRRMRPSDYVTATEVLALAIWIEIAIRVIPFARLLEPSRRASLPAPAASAIPGEYRRLQRFVVVAYDVLPLPGTCLRHSLVLCALLERRGVSARVRFGVAKRGPALAAHSWVECAGVAGDETAASYGELCELSLTGRL